MLDWGTSGHLGFRRKMIFNHGSPTWYVIKTDITPISNILVNYRKVQSVGMGVTISCPDQMTIVQIPNLVHS